LETPEGVESVSLRNAMNEVMRNSYVKDCEIGIKRWNMQVKRAGYETLLRLPSSRFRRSIGSWSDLPVDPDGNIIERDAYERRLVEWLPTESDQAFVHSLMQPVTEPGKMAGWIAPPDRGINKLPVDYEYVRLN
jgi:benzoyl-CoA 2,3-dioxygenase component B